MYDSNGQILNIIYNLCKFAGIDHSFWDYIFFKYVELKISIQLNVSITDVWACEVWNKIHVSKSFLYEEYKNTKVLPRTEVYVVKKHELKNVALHLAHVKLMRKQYATSNSHAFWILYYYNIAFGTFIYDIYACVL